MQRTWLWIPLLMLSAALAGCHEKTLDSTDDEDEPPPSFVTAVSIRYAPAGAAAMSEPEVCWSVEGEGTIAHTAIHWALVQPNKTQASFADYPSGVAYPDNRTSLDPAGYALPDVFCTAFTMPDSTIYVVAHAIGARDGPPGIISAERMIQVASS